MCCSVVRSGTSAKRSDLPRRYNKVCATSAYSSYSHIVGDLTRGSGRWPGKPQSFLGVINKSVRKVVTFSEYKEPVLSLKRRVVKCVNAVTVFKYIAVVCSRHGVKFGNKNTVSSSACWRMQIHQPLSDRCLLFPRQLVR